jgi:hypothetical protein
LRSQSYAIPRFPAYGTSSRADLVHELDLSATDKALIIQEERLTQRFRQLQDRVMHRGGREETTKTPGGAALLRELDHAGLDLRRLRTAQGCVTKRKRRTRAQRKDAEQRRVKEIREFDAAQRREEESAWPEVPAESRKHSRHFNKLVTPVKTGAASTLHHVAAEQFAEGDCLEEEAAD